MKRVLNVLSQSMEGWIPQLRPVVLFVHFATVVVAVAWAMFKWLNPTYSYFGEMVLRLVGGSAVLGVLGYIFFQQEERKWNRPSPVPLTDEQICYRIVKELVGRWFDYFNALSFEKLDVLMRRRSWRFSGSMYPENVLAEFADKTKLLEVDFYRRVVYPTTLARKPDDRSLANMLIADFEQMSDSASVNDLIEDLRQLTPRGLELVRLHRDAKKTVRKAKSS